MPAIISALKSIFAIELFSLLPGNRAVSYTILILISAGLAVFYFIRHQTPWKKSARLEVALENTEVMLRAAKSDSSINYGTALDLESRLLQAQLSASKISKRILEVTDEESWVGHLQAIGRIYKSISKCAQDLEDIRTDALIALEDERQRFIAKEISNAGEVLHGIRVPAPEKSSCKFRLLFEGVAAANPKRTPFERVDCPLDHGNATTLSGRTMKLHDKTYLSSESRRNVCSRMRLKGKRRRRTKLQWIDISCGDPGHVHLWPFKTWVHGKPGSGAIWHPWLGWYKEVMRERIVFFIRNIEFSDTVDFVWRPVCELSSQPLLPVAETRRPERDAIQWSTPSWEYYPIRRRENCPDQLMRTYATPGK
ncbi:hypothetical protein FB45DRAFT_1011295 [Roridomyces roridus]|uniref:Uncharacterized protein n=1 Tax=Roridomyces roridus TaxID=1738132 RepID=A0AAD7FAN5_9AGAR|nr:hypothetical protein FB45DRAFT_1011295 [Roridomyces roridus]